MAYLPGIDEHAGQFQQVQLDQRYFFPAKMLLEHFGHGVGRDAHAVEGFEFFFTQRRQCVQLFDGRVECSGIQVAEIDEQLVVFYIDRHRHAVAV